LVALFAMVAWSEQAQAAPSADEIVARMRANGTSIQDYDATITIDTYVEGEPGRTQTMRLLLLQPDRMRQEYLEPEYLAGNLNVVEGNKMWTYIAASDTWYESDLADLSAAEQPWLGFRQILRAAQDELADYAFELVEADGETFHLRGTPSVDEAAYGRIELWVDGATFVPTRRVLYDVDAHLLVDVRISDVEEVAEGAYVARRLETYDEDGILRSVIRYESVRVNQGLDPTLFAPPALETP
jgi:outer membrane lipoprotein-sorting protein